MNLQRVSILAFALGLAWAPLPAGAQLFGPSDEEMAREAAQDSSLQDLTARTQQQDSRIRALEDKVRGLTQSLSQATGTNEELGHQIRLQNDKISKMERDFAYQLCTLSAQQLGAGDSINCAAAGTASASAAPYAPPPSGMRPGAALPPLGAGTIDASGNAPPPGNGGAVGGRPPGTLGTLPAAPPLGQAVGADPALYDQGINLMGRLQYSEASAAFRAYADANPNDADLSPQAIYWIGNISFIRQDYASAQRAFAEVIKKYPKSPRAPDAMLKLAQSFMSLGQKSEGCTTLALIRSRYPNGSPQTLASAANLRKTACAK
ncbi:MAG TPA: tol-pal system protein YbgF [Rhizomicrobium sp.]|nr:tol-pal system protein YbgF [Rhizomicrobium sp.]